ncbi:family 20 glycosylhydrolase [Flavobacteriales bacterium]|nr:family 20 glycosylhydrolase [Flavobacteriales bacterium]
MKYMIHLAIMSLIMSCTGRKEKVEMIETVSIIPIPNSFTYSTNSFVLNPDTKIYAPQECLVEAEFLQMLIKNEFEFTVSIQSTECESNCIKLTTNQISDSTHQGAEAYHLIIEPSLITINGHSNQGLFWGIQSLHQVFNQTDHQDGYAARIQGLKILDQPKFRHRGLLLDCCRHFFSKDVVKKYIELLSYYKMNVLHWHLTEDQGWRIEIEKYPELTQHGAWRIDADGIRYGGYYTKEDIQEIVAFATKHQVNIIPEIELPGHSQAAISSYPYLSCKQENVAVANDWGVFKEIYCAGNDSTFEFIENVLKEVMELFPYQYIHIGGDEAPKYRWEKCDKCQKRLVSENLKDEHELQSYFIQRIETFLNANDKKLIGWDEILEGGLSPNATVQSWRGIDGGMRAAKNEHYAIMSPTSHCYIDYPLDAIDLKKVYSFNPIPDSLSPDKQHYILGGEVNMWTEHVPDEKNLDSKVFPRMLALSEVLWSGTDTSRYENFRNRVYNHFDVLDSLGVAYGAEAIPIRLITKGDSTYIIKNNRNIDLQYLIETADCTAKFQPYKEPIYTNMDGMLKARSVKNLVPFGETIEQHFCKRAENVQSISYRNMFSENYVGGGNNGLFDGKLGSLNFRDGNWQGFWGKHAEVTIAFENEQVINQVSAQFYHYINSWIFRPESMEVSVSENGTNWIPMGNIKSEIQKKKRGKMIIPMSINFKRPFLAKYLKIKALSVLQVPGWHEAAGADAWLFIDEIKIQ